MEHHLPALHGDISVTQTLWFMEQLSQEGSVDSVENSTKKKLLISFLISFFRNVWNSSVNNTRGHLLAGTPPQCFSSKAFHALRDGVNQSQMRDHTYQLAKGSQIHQKQVQSSDSSDLWSRGSLDRWKLSSWKTVSSLQCLGVCFCFNIFHFNRENAS